MVVASPIVLGRLENSSFLLWALSASLSHIMNLSDALFLSLHLYLVQFVLKRLSINLLIVSIFA